MDPILPPLREPCVCTSLRAASRHITRMYDDALAPLALTITGYSLLGKIDRLRAPSMNELADAAEMDRSTLSRKPQAVTRIQANRDEARQRPATQRILADGSRP